MWCWVEWKRSEVSWCKHKELLSEFWNKSRHAGLWWWNEKNAGIAGDYLSDYLSRRWLFVCLKSTGGARGTGRLETINIWAGSTKQIELPKSNFCLGKSDKVTWRKLNREFPGENATNWVLSLSSGGKWKATGEYTINQSLQLLEWHLGTPSKIWLLKTMGKAIPRLL